MNASDIVSSIVGGFTGLLSGCASAIVQLFQTVMQNATEVSGVTTYSGISPVGTWILVFIGIGLSAGILRAVRAKVL